MTYHAPSPTGPTKEFGFTDADFNAIASLAKQRFGLDLQASKKPLIYSRLAKRLRVLRLDSFAEYCRRLQDNLDTAEEDHLLTALTTNVTQFFREPHHFTFLRNVIGPDLLDRARSGHPIRLWSAACSSGEEAYCLAATMMSLLPKQTKYDIRILATDIDHMVIAKADRGIYPTDQLSQIPADLKGEMVASCALSGQFAIAPHIKKLVTFGKLNLISDWPMRQPFDLIMCRNAAIYFDKDTQSQLWARFAKCLRPNGHLMIGHSERLSGAAVNQFKSVGVTTYRKRAGAATDQLCQ